jgi:hypothetical protein
MTKRRNPKTTKAKVDARNALRAAGRRLPPPNPSHLIPGLNPETRNPTTRKMTTRSPSWEIVRRMEVATARVGVSSKMRKSRV